LDESDSSVLEAVRAVRWPARRLLRSGQSGAHISRMLGHSAEFVEYRAYRQGDETRRIDWKLLARTDRAYVRLAQDHAILPTMLLLDASASMAYPAGTLAKWRHARQIALGLSAATHQGGDPVGIVVAQGAADGDQEHLLRLSARTRRGVVQEIAKLLQAVTPSGTVALAPQLGAMRSSQRAVIISDFLGDAQSLLGVAAQFLTQGKEVYAIHVIDSAELEPPHFAVLYVDPENNHFRRPMVEATRARYQAQFGAWREALAREWRMRGANYIQVTTQEPAAFAIRRITRTAHPAGM
jgi:uncharacterized protein (DUF58 family)